ncbi:M20 family metallopeptidase [Roseivivax sp. GX 12232]|uniref:M20 aminoacylase family protein n=1 Tax=Roseivivax sp. GX 12232 TaxID=2900547 RepID=UPI001E2B8885|nr:M20 aminoacylase family protein [Roseivivax sp. GX 12232]MCE0504583.1 M20 family metallopeptidase [Roseivivax sp. GX 12232]
MPPVNRIAEFAAEMAEWRHHLHANPELSLDCHETGAFVAEKLRGFGLDEVHEGIARTGVVGLIRGQGAGPVTGLRADMDALPMTEETGAPHASKVPGRMHACGHDGHTAMLLGAARYLAETRNFAGTVAVIFQPAEESGGGGGIMVEEGIMERFGIEEVYAIHTDPANPEGRFSTRPGPIMAAVDDFTITLKGQGGHAARPHGTRDPIPAAMGLGLQMQTIAARNTDPMKQLVVSITQIHSGSAWNVIPDSAMIAGTVRSFDPEVRDMAERRIRALAEAAAAGGDLEVEIDYDRSYPPTVNHADQTAFAARIAAEVAGDAGVDEDTPPVMGAEDFSYMLEARPGAYVKLGQGVGPGVHNAKFDFNDAVAPLGASFFVKLIETRHGRAA